MKKCTLCGGNLDANKRCTFCGLDNTKNDEMYKHLLNRNDCADEPLTHVHEERPVRKVAYEREYSAKTNGKKVLGIIAVVLTIVSSIFGIVGDILEEEYDTSYEEEVNDDPYAWVNYDLPETGMEYSIALEPGVYTVGVHLPEGTYTATVHAGAYGVIEIHDFENSIYLYENIGFEDEQTIVEDLRLYKGGHFTVSTGIKVTLDSKNVQSTELISKGNGLTKQIALNEEQTAGEDFPAGVYDVLYAPSEMKQNVPVEVELEIPLDGYEYDFSIWFEGTLQTECYRNVVIPDGTVVLCQKDSGVVLVPSEKIMLMDIDEFYERY